MFRNQIFLICLVEVVQLEFLYVKKKIENTLRNTFISINRLPLRYTYRVVYSSLAGRCVAKRSGFFEPLHPRCPRDASEITPRRPLHHVQKVLIFKYL